jgi:hypothetical protein
MGLESIVSKRRDFGYRSGRTKSWVKLQQNCAELDQLLRPSDVLRGEEVLDRTYVASANNITDSINAATGLQNPGSVLTLTGTGSIYAGAPRSFIGGLKLAFR